MTLVTPNRKAQLSVHLKRVLCALLTTNRHQKLQVWSENFIVNKTPLELNFSTKIQT